VLVKDAATDRARLDVWLDVACLFKTRSEAQRACRGGKVTVNDQRAKPHRTIQSGDRLSITRQNGRSQQVVIRSLATQHVLKAAARALYDDVTPPPTAAELEFRRFGAGPPRRRGPGRTPTDATPNTRQRRQLRRLKGH
jgi:ribosome-associated heat shock protein Hsp15